MKIMITGGCGYIGSHLVQYFASRNYFVIAIDKVMDSTINSKSVKYYRFDILDSDKLCRVLREEDVSCVIHCAGELGIEKSRDDPQLYYTQNIFLTQCVLNAMVSCGVKCIIFSSSAAVYSESFEIMREEHPVSSHSSPYAMGKIVSERTIADIAGYGINYVILRYFNVVGCYECPSLIRSYFRKRNALPLLFASYKEDVFFNLLGDDYPTHDGTCVRDYIHIDDLCILHGLAVEKLERSIVNEVFNVGSGIGCSVLELTNQFNCAVNCSIKLQVLPRRVGDSAFMIANIDKAAEFFGWHPRYTLFQTIRELNQFLNVCWMSSDKQES